MDARYNGHVCESPAAYRELACTHVWIEGNILAWSDEGHEDASTAHQSYAAPGEPAGIRVDRRERVRGEWPNITLNIHSKCRKEKDDEVRRNNRSERPVGRGDVE